MSNPTKPLYNFPVIPLRGGWRVETWYNRQASSWVSVLKDSYGNQKGDSCYDGHAASVDASRTLLVTRHGEMFADLDLTVAESVV